VPLSICWRQTIKVGEDTVEEKKEPIITEEQAYGNDCPNGACDV
jgi:hypothetical protein